MELPFSSFDMISKEPGASQAEASSTTPAKSDHMLASPHSSTYKIRLQSNRFPDDVSDIDPVKLNGQISQDLEDRFTEVADTVAAAIFPDTAFGFPITEDFVKNFHGAFLTQAGYLDPTNFYDDKTTAIFLNKMTSTIAHFLRATKQSNLKPLRYFTALHSSTPVGGSSIKRMPDVVVTRLINGCTRKGRLKWTDIQALIEHTREKKPPMRMPVTVNAKTFLMFCNQPERDYVVCICISGEGFHIVMTDHVGQVDTDVIPFSRASSVAVFFRVLMGLTFLPDEWLGVDPTITRRELGTSTGQVLESAFPPFAHQFFKPSIPFALPASSIPMESPLAVTYDPPIDREDRNISTISVGANTYQVVEVLFQAQTLIGRATRVFLVKLPSGQLGVLKDAWIAGDRESEANFINGLPIPFGPELVDHCILRNTDTFRSSATRIAERREKRRIVTSPAGVHISDFSSCWELMVAFLDVIIAIMYLESKRKVHRDISYTNILLREPGVDKPDKKAIRDKVMAQLGLSEIDVLRKKLGCREGLLIDFDYASSLVESITLPGPETGHNGSGAGQDQENQEDQEDSEDQGDQEDQGQDADGDEDEEGEETTVVRPHPNKPLKISGARTGTPPFMALELLLYGAPHRAIHDVESLAYVLMFICSHLGGPHNTVREPPLYGGKYSSTHPSQMKEWLTATRLTSLGHLKYSHMLGHFNASILSHFSPYFDPLKVHIVALWNVIFPVHLNRVDQHGVHSVATFGDIIKVFKTALLDEKLIKEAANPPTVLGKRSVPGDLTMVGDGWDVVKVTKRELEVKPKMKQQTKRSAKLMEKTPRVR